MNAQAEMDRAFRTVAQTLGETVSYQRPANSALNAIGAFTLVCLIDTAGEFAGPKGPAFGQVTALLGDIPSGPQKGDQVTWNNAVYMVQDLSPDAQLGQCQFRIRKMGS